MGRYTKIVATLGPASESPEQVDALLGAGVDVFRLNLSHGDLEEHFARLALVRERSSALGRPVAVLADLPGPKVRAGEFPDGGVFLTEGATLRLVPGEGTVALRCDQRRVPEPAGGRGAGRHLQKAIVRACVAAGIPVITATQMLESMSTAPTPTRAEVSDVANAVFDGTDAVMLSAETAIGRDPPLVVRTMARIAERAEREASYAQWANRLGRTQRESFPEGPERITKAISHAAWQAAADIGVDAILCCTRSGRTVRAMARFRPLTKMLGLSPSDRTVRAMALTWGVTPMAVGTYGSTDDLVWCVIEAAVTAGHIGIGDVVAVLAGAPDQVDGATDVLRIVRVR